jgi:hypothetical protein
MMSLKNPEVLMREIKLKPDFKKPIKINLKITEPNAKTDSRNIEDEDNKTEYQKYVFNSNAL